MNSLVCWSSLLNRLNCKLIKILVWEFGTNQHNVNIAIVSPKCMIIIYSFTCHVTQAIRIMYSRQIRTHKNSFRSGALRWIVTRFKGQKLDITISNSCGLTISIIRSSEMGVAWVVGGRGVAVVVWCGEKRTPLKAILSHILQVGKTKSFSLCKDQLQATGINLR